MEASRFPADYDGIVAGAPAVALDQPDDQRHLEQPGRRLKDPSAITPQSTPSSTRP